MSTFQAIHGRKAMKAYTLIELMIYVFLSAIVVSSAFAGISSFYHNNFSHNGMFSILENARLLQESINHEVKKAGYKYKPTSSDLHRFPEEFGFKAGESIILRNDFILFYRFYGDRDDNFLASFDCTGRDLPRVDVVYYVRIRQVGNSVTCQRFERDEVVRNPNALSGLDPVADPVVFATGIENFIFWAGMDDDDDGYVDFYVRGDNFKNRIEAGDVVSLRYRFDVVVNDNTTTTNQGRAMIREPFDRVIYLRN